MKVSVRTSIAAVLSSLCDGLVLRPLLNDSLDVLDAHQGRQMSIWVHAFARSGSSTIMSMVSDTEMLQHAGADCWTFCGNKEGYCEWCGPSNACCRRGKSESTPGCTGVTNFLSDGTTHECVASVNSSYEQHVQAEGQPYRVFSIFEPCDVHDKLEDPLSEQGCNGLMRQLTQCDFSHINELRGWRDTAHSNVLGLRQYSKEMAEVTCKSADVLTFKTVAKPTERFTTKGGDLSLLRDDPQMRMIHVIRDPRAVYGSWFSTWPFNQEYERIPSKLLEICDDYNALLDLKHPRVHQVVFEKLIMNPQAEMEKLYAFLRMRFGEAQLNWLNRTFNAKDCSGVDQYIAPYSDCHTESKASLEKWQQVLTDEEKTLFQNHPSCQKVAAAYGY